MKTRDAAIGNRDAEQEQVAREQASKRGHLDKLKEEVDKAQASHAQLVYKMTAQLEATEKTLAAAEKVVAVGCEAFVSLELKSREALEELYGKGLKKPLVTDEEGHAELPPQIVTPIEGVVNGIGPMGEGGSKRSLCFSLDARLHAPPSSRPEHRPWSSARACGRGALHSHCRSREGSGADPTGEVPRHGTRASG